MSDGTDSNRAHAIDEGYKMAERNVIDKEAAASVARAEWIASGHTGLSPKALTAFGNALHTITDGTSPAHEGLQPWYGKWHLSSLIHFFRESRISPERLSTAVAVSQEAFAETFGTMWLEHAKDGLNPHSTHKIVVCGGEHQLPCEK